MLQKCNDNFNKKKKRTRRIPHSLIRSFSPLLVPRHRGCARPFLRHHNISQLLARTPNRRKTITKPGQEPHSPALAPGPPLLPHLLRLSSSCSTCSISLCFPLSRLLHFPDAIAPPFASIQSSDSSPVLPLTLFQAPSHPRNLQKSH